MSRKNKNNYEPAEEVVTEDVQAENDDALETEVQQEAPLVKKYEVIAKEALNIRSAPKIDNNVVGIIGRGIIVDAPLVDGEVQVDGEFTYVIAEGAVGFAMSKFLKEV